MRSDRLSALVGAVAPGDAGAAQDARRRHDRLAKPPGSLGEIETVGVQLAALAGRSPPPVPQEPAAVIAAGDHGVHAQAVSAWPQTVTAVMVQQLAAGAVSAGAVARTVGARVHVLDVGVAADLPASPALTAARVRAGTADWTAGPAMERSEAEAAVLAGADLARHLAGDGVDLLVAGEMGIANTTTAAALIAAVTRRPAADVVGPGAAADAATVARKVGVVDAGLQRHRPDPADPVGVLAAVGGLEHAALVGVMLAGAVERVPVVLDGVSTLAAALLAERMAPSVVGALLAGHRSSEPGAGVALDALGLRPLLDLSLCLGEATGGLLAVPLVVAAARVLADVVTLEDLGFA